MLFFPAVTHKTYTWHTLCNLRVMEKVTTALVLFLALSTAIHAGDTKKYSVADVMERHHGLSGPVFFVKANHLMANEKMSDSLGIQFDHHPGSGHRSQKLERAEDTQPYRTSKRGPSFSEVSEKHRSGYSTSQPERAQAPQKRYTAFRLEDKPSSI